MTDKKMSNFELATLNYFLTRAFLIGTTFNAILNILNQDSWIVPIISILPAIITVFFVNYIMDYRKELNLAEKIKKLFGGPLSKIMLVIIFLISVFYCVLNILNISDFVQSQFLNKTPIKVILITFMVTSLYIAKKGINVISRTSNILFYISILLSIIAFIGLLPVFKISNLKPFFSNNLSNYLSSSTIFYVYNIIPIFMLTIIPKECFKSEKIKKALFLSYVISALSLFFIVFQTIATFGYELTNLYEYPEFFVLKHVVLINLSSRLESILIIQIIFDMIIYSIFSVYFISNITEAFFNTKRSNIIYLIIAIIVLIMAIIISKYSININTFAINIVPIISIIVIILIILIFIKIKIGKK